MGRWLDGTAEFDYFGSRVQSKITAWEPGNQPPADLMRAGASVSIYVRVDDDGTNHFDVEVTGVNGTGINMLLDNVADILANHLSFTLRPTDNDND